MVPVKGRGLYNDQRHRFARLPPNTFVTADPDIPESFSVGILTFIKDSGTVFNMIESDNSVMRLGVEGKRLVI
jgi:hypothetical protein